MGGYESLPSPVPAGIMVYNHVGRHLPGGYMGDANSLPTTINSGQTYDYSYNYTLPNDYDEEYVHVVGILMNVQNGQVLNAGKSDYLPGYSNAKPFFHSQPQTIGHLGSNYQYDVVTHDPEHAANTITSLGSLPPGLSLTDHGDGKAVISGTPTQLGTFTITLNVNDGVWDVEQEFQVTITDASADWVQVGDPGFTGFEANELSLKIADDGTVWVLSSSWDNSNMALHKWENSQWAQQGTFLSANGFAASLELDNNGIPFAYNGEDMVYKFDSGSWQQVGGNIANFARAQLVFDNNNSAHLLGMIPSNGNNQVFSFDGTSWNGPGTFTDGISVWVKTTRDMNNTPYVIYGTDGQGIAYSEVASWDGSSWNLVGGGYVDPTSQTYFEHDVAITSNGDVYVALVVGVGVEQLNIYQLVGNSWTKSEDNLTGSAVGYVDLEADANGNLYLAFKDNGSSGKTSVMKYDGNSWTQVGLAGFTPIADNQALALGSDGLPYVAYSDADESEAVSVKQYLQFNTSIEPDKEGDQRILIAPNPAYTAIHVSWEELGVNPTKMNVYDVLGRVVKVVPINDQTSLDLNIIDLSPGKYLIEISDLNKSVTSVLLKME